jgi:hypothetical protein
MALLMAGCASHEISPQQPANKATAKDFEAAIAAMNARDHILSDKILIQKFQKNRSIFEKIRQMIATDPELHRVDEDWTDPKNPAEVGVSTERIAEYRRLLAKVGCRRGFDNYPASDGIYFISGTSGLAIAGTTKGYCYLESTPKSIVRNTETYKSPEADDEYTIFRPIEGHWYLYFESF